MLIYRIKKSFLKLIFKFIKNEKIKQPIIDLVLGKQIECPSIYKYWLSYPNSDRFFAVLEHNYNKTIDIDYLIFAVVLYKKKQYKRCKEVILEYVDKYGTDKIADFFPILPFVKSIGITDENIEKSLVVLKEITKNKKDEIFKEYIKNKRIAIVGNAENEIGKFKAEEIDNHEIVVRFNNFVIKNYEIDYGTKVNVWMINNLPVIEQRNEDELKKIDFLIIRSDIWFNGLTDKIRDIAYECITKYHIKTIYMNEKTQKSIKKYAKINNPTNGILFFHYLYKILKINLKFIDLYAFSFLYSDKIKSYQHYYEKISDTISDEVIKVHSMDNQNQYFIKHYKKKKK